VSAVEVFTITPSPSKNFLQRMKELHGKGNKINNANPLFRFVASKLTLTNGITEERFLTACRAVNQEGIDLTRG